MHCSPVTFVKRFGGPLTLAVRFTSSTRAEYKRVVALLDEHYDELWVGGKASYKLGGIIEEGGELIIYAPASQRDLGDTRPSDREVWLCTA